MIVVDKRGRLGNEMFQYAFGVAAAKQLGTFCAYNTWPLETYFVLEPALARTAKRWAVRISERARPFRRREVVTDDRERPEAVLDELTDRTRYGGFFYSERFFGSAAGEVRRRLTVRPEHMERFNEKYGALVDRGYVCAHARLTDFFEYRGNVTVSPGYYERARETLGTDAPMVFVSDDVATAAATLGEPWASFEANDPILDFLLIRHARHVIASNSSFCWWAAWLNDTPGCRVIAPRWWLGVNQGREFPVHAIPDRWEQVAAREETDASWCAPVPVALSGRR